MELPLPAVLKCDRTWNSKRRGSALLTTLFLILILAMAFALLASMLHLQSSLFLRERNVLKSRKMAESGLYVMTERIKKATASLIPENSKPAAYDSSIPKRIPPITAAGALTKPPMIATTNPFSPNIRPIS